MIELGYGLSKLPIYTDGKVNKKEAEKIINLAIEQGISIFDTSTFYFKGESESVLGNVLEKHNKKCKVCTKVSLKDFSNKEEFLVIFHAQLKRLKRNYIDYYLIHGFDEERLKKFNTLNVYSWLTELKKQGKIKNIGFSFHGKYNLLIKIVETYQWDVCMIKFSPLEPNFETGENAIKYLENKNIKIFLIQPYFGGAFLAILDTIDKKMALFYKICSSYNIEAIFMGTKTQQHLLENINIYNNCTHETDELENFTRLKELYISNKEIPCDGCSECTVCNQNIAIPYIFMIYNIYKITKNKQRFITDYETIVRKHGNYRR